MFFLSLIIHFHKLTNPERFEITATIKAKAWRPL